MRDVLKIVEYVKYQKNNGTLYVLPDSVAWMLQNKNEFSLVCKYSDIKCKYE